MEDTIFKRGYVMTMDAQLGVLEQGDVHVRDGRIHAVGTNLVAPGARVVEADGHILSPGFIDGHRHAWQSLLRPIASNWSFPQYMAEARAMYSGCFDAEAAYIANLMGGLESINAGITSIVDHSHLQKSPDVSDALARGLLESGVGGFFCYALQNVPDYLSSDSIDGDAIGKMLTRPADDWHYLNAERIRKAHFAGSGGALGFGVALFEGTAYVPAEISKGLFQRASRLKPSLITAHWNAISKPGIYISSLSELASAGLLEIPTLLSHNNDLNDDDLKVMVASRVGACTCPDTECGMGLGAMMARRFSEIGGGASLGIDITCYAEANMLQQARLYLQVERLEAARVYGSMSASIGLKAHAAMELLTSSGAKALGQGDEIGSLTPGKRADVVMTCSAAMNGLPVTDPASVLLFYTNNADIKSVMVAGRLLKHNGVLATPNLAAVQSRAANALDRIQERYRSLPHTALQNAWASMF